MYHQKRKTPRSVKIAVAVVAGGILAFALYMGYDRLRRPEPTPPPPVEQPKPPEPPVSPEIPVPEEKPEEPLPPPLPKGVTGNKRWLHVVKGSYRLYLYRGETLERTFAIAVGANQGQKERVGDHRTPTGNFSVQQIQNSSSWTHDFRDGAGQVAGAYGPWFIRLKTPGWSGIGIHGTHAPESIGSRATEGCIRVRNEELVELKEKVFVGMKVVISE